MFELSADNGEYSVLAPFKQVQSGCGQPALPGWGSVVENSEVKGPIDLQKLVFLLASPSVVSCVERGLF